jgi:WD40 repeat protein
MLLNNQSLQNGIQNLKYGLMATSVFAAIRRLSRLGGELVFLAVLLGAIALIFSSAPGDSPAHTSPPLLAKFPQGLVEALEFSPDGKTLASSGRDHALRLWNMTNSCGIDHIQPTIIEHATAGLALAFSPDGKTLVTGGEKSLVIWSYETGQCPSPRELASETVRCLAFSPDGRTLALGCDDGSVRLWDMPAAHERAVLEAHVDVVRSLSFSPDGRRLVSTGQDRLVILWDAEEGVGIRPLEVDIPGYSPVRFAAFSPDGSYVAVGGVAAKPTHIVLLDAETGELRTQLTGLTAGINALAFSPDGRTLATAGVDRCIKFWDIVHCRLHSTASDDVGFVTSLAFSPDGARMAFAGFDDTVRILDIKQGKSVVLGRGRGDRTGKE